MSWKNPYLGRDLASPQRGHLLTGICKTYRDNPGWQQESVTQGAQSQLHFGKTLSIPYFSLQTGDTRICDFTAAYTSQSQENSGSGRSKPQYTGM